MGGLFGVNYDGTVSICYSTGSVDDANGNGYEVGGLVGVAYGGTLSNCYSTCSVDGETFVGGLVGNDDGDTLNVNYCFWDTETSNQSSSAGGTGKTTTEMKTQSTFTTAGWDFTNVWAINGSINIGYAYLQDNVPPTLNWTGVTDTNWETDSNWDLGYCPRSIDDVIIPVVTNQPVIGAAGTADCNHLTILSGARLTLNASSSLITNGIILNNGTIDVQRTITDGQWHLISSPITSATAAVFAGDYLQYWTESTADWTDITTSTYALTPAQGYGHWGVAKSETTYTFTGTPNTGNQSIGITASGSGDYTGANLLGNPYPSSIDWSELDGAEGYGAVYYWDAEDSRYASWNDGSAVNGGVQYIPPMQGFFIVDDAGAFFLMNVNRTHSGASTFFKAKQEISANAILLEAQNGILRDELFIKVNEAAITGYEKQFDAWKFFSGTPGMPEIYSYGNEDKLAIDVRPETDVIQLGFSNSENGIYTIGIKEMADISIAIFEDTKTNTFHDLTKSSYGFAWDIGDDEMRFKLHLDAVGIEENVADKKEIFIYSSGKEIFIKGADASQVRVVDMMGRTVLEKYVHRSTLTSFETDLKTGVYVVSVRNGNLVRAEKVFIR
nr:T9SS type A sorting domain-containing protein [Bacteroidota bacterium]